MNRKTLKVTFIIFALAMVLLFFYFGLGLSNNSGWQEVSFMLNDRAKIAGILLLISYPVYRILKRNSRP